MKTLFLRKHPLNFAAFLLAVVLLGTSCKKDKDDNKDSGFPRTVTIEYKVTTSSGLPKADIMYTNETGGWTSLDETSLPFTKKFDRKLTEPDGIGLDVTSFSAGKVRLEILVNGKSVKAQEFDQSPVISATIEHAFVQ